MNQHAQETICFITLFWLDNNESGTVASNLHLGLWCLWAQNWLVECSPKYFESGLMHGTKPFSAGGAQSCHTPKKSSDAHPIDSIDAHFHVNEIPSNITRIYKPCFYFYLGVNKTIAQNLEIDSHLLFELLFFASQCQLCGPQVLPAQTAMFQPSQMPLLLIWPD